MKKILIVAATLMIATTLIVQAQRQKNRRAYAKDVTAETLAERKLVHLTGNLQLTEAQQTEFKTVLLSTSRDRIAASSDAKRSISEINKMENEKLMEILTPEQKAQYEAINAERVKKMKKRNSVRKKGGAERKNLRMELEKDK